MAGRPKGSKNVTTLNKTRVLQGCFSEDDINKWATNMKERMDNPETTNSEFVQLFSAIAKFLFITQKEYTDYELLTETIGETISSKEEADALREKLREMLASKN